MSSFEPSNTIGQATGPRTVLPTVIRELSRGPTNVVVLALLEGPGGFQKPCIVRRLRHASSRDREARAQLLRAGALGERLGHPHLLETFASGEAGDLPFLCTEFVSGGSARAILRAALELGFPVPPAVAIRMMVDLLSALHYLHNAHDVDGTRLSVVHRMVSLETLLTGFDGRTRLSDLRGAVLLGDRPSLEVDVIVGKEGYIAPEHVTTGVVDVRLDIFAAGVVLWELLTGERMPVDLTAGDDLPLASSRALHLDRRIDQIVGRALHRDAERRYGSVLEFGRDLEAYARARGLDGGHGVVGDLVLGYFADARERQQREIGAFAQPLVSPVAEVPPSEPPSGSRFRATTGTDPGQPIAGLVEQAVVDLFGAG